MTKPTSRSPISHRRTANNPERGGRLQLESLEPRLALATGLLDTLVSVVDGTGASLSAQRSEADAAAVAEGQELVARVRLARRPDAPVTITFGSDDPTDVLPNRPALTFTRGTWNLVQRVAFRAVDDGMADGDRTTAIRMTVSTPRRSPVTKSLWIESIDAGPAAGVGDAQGVSIATTSLPATASRIERANFRWAYEYTVRYLPRFQTYSAQVSAMDKGRINKLIAPQSPMSPAYKSVVAINVDTLYTSATVDLTEQPQILTIPAYDYSYSIIQVDGSGTVLPTGLTATAAGGTYALVGPDYRGPLPAGVTRIDVGVNWSQIAIRTSRYTQDADGTGYVDTTTQAEVFRAATRLQSLSLWLQSPHAGGATQILPIAGNYSFPMKTFVDGTLQANPRAFLEILEVALRTPSSGPLSASDRVVIANFDGRFQAAKATAANGNMKRMNAIAAGARAAHADVIARWRTNTIGNNWVHFNNLGNWGRRYLDRAAGNLYLQYGNVKSAAYYAQAFVDSSGQVLSGANGQTYTITFAADQIPESQRFWSITAYTGDAIELVPNAANKYAVASYTPGLVTNPDGSITVTLRTIGGSETTVDPNTLPIPAGVCSVMLRVYAPLGEALAGTYVPPPVRRVQSFGLTVDSTSDLYAAGHATTPITPNGGGTLPPYVNLPAGTGRTISFTTVGGSVSYNDVDAPPAFIGQYNGPDGGAVLFQDATFPNTFLTTSTPPGLLPPSVAGAPTTFYMDMASFNGISGLKLYESDPSARRVMFLAGVFTSNAPPANPAPAILDFSSTALGTSFASLSPQLNQTFYIGDGLTGTGTGSAQEFVVPDAATHLYLGIVDGSYFVGNPDYYDNNRGSFSVQGVVVS